MSQSPSLYGLTLPTQTGMLAGNPRDSAIASQASTNSKLSALNKAVGGKGRGKKKYKKCKTCKKRRCRHQRGGGTNDITVPQFTMQYTPTNGPGQTPNDIIKQNTAVTTQGNANSVFDKYATQKGGYIYGKKRGGYVYSKKLISEILSESASRLRSKIREKSKYKTKSKTYKKKSL